MIPKTLAATTYCSLLLLAGCERSALDQRMEELCKVDGGVKVFEQVPLPASDFDQEGTPLSRYWLDASPVRSDTRLGPDYRYVFKREVLKAGEPLSGSGELVKRIEQVYRKADNRLLGTAVTYGRRGGDLIVLGHPSSRTCPQQIPDLLKSIFIQARP